MKIEIRAMVPGDYDEIHQLWSATEGLSLGDDDNRDGIDLYLRRNSGLCFVAMHAGKIVGTALCGHDGRRGILRHLVVMNEHRGRGLAKLLVRACLDALAGQGIRKCNIFVMNYNVTGMKFWEHIGFYHLQDDYRTLQLGTATPFRSGSK